MRLFGEYWVQVFGAPEAVLVDKGPAFKSKTFQSYVYNYLAADLIYCGTGYPQGNAINEAVHKGIESSIMVRRQYDTASSFEEIIGDVVMAYNSTPHSATGLSPYYMLFGKELMLPGLQRYREGLPERVRKARIADNRIRAMHRAILNTDEGLRLYKATALKPGDQVVYYLRTSEREGVEVDHGQELVKYSPKWSTPVRVKSVRMGTVELELANNEVALLPERLVRKIGKNVPPSLQTLALNKLNREPARLSTRPDWEQGIGSKRPRTE